MHIQNPEWHPKSLAELSVAQRRNLKRLQNSQVLWERIGGNSRGSFLSLIRHGLAERAGDHVRITAKGLTALSGSGF